VATLGCGMVDVSKNVNIMSVTTTAKRSVVITINEKDSFLRLFIALKVSLLHLSYFTLLVVTVRLSAW